MNNFFKRKLLLLSFISLFLPSLVFAMEEQESVETVVLEKDQLPNKMPIAQKKQSNKRPLLRTSSWPIIPLNDTEKMKHEIKNILHEVKCSLRGQKMYENQTRMLFLNLAEKIRNLEHGIAGFIEQQDSNNSDNIFDQLKHCLSDTIKSDDAFTETEHYTSEDLVDLQFDSRVSTRQTNPFDELTSLRMLVQSNDLTDNYGTDDLSNTSQCTDTVIVTKIQKNNEGELIPTDYIADAKLNSLLSFNGDTEKTESEKNYSAQIIGLFRLQQARIDELNKKVEDQSSKKDKKPRKKRTKSLKSKRSAIKRKNQDAELSGGPDTTVLKLIEQEKNEQPKLEFEKGSSEKFEDRLKELQQLMGYKDSHIN